MKFLVVVHGVQLSVIADNIHQARQYVSETFQALPEHIHVTEYVSGADYLTVMTVDYIDRHIGAEIVIKALESLHLLEELMLH